MATTITANGINFPDGSAGTPSIGGSDTNTGLFTGSDIIGFATGGSERLKIDASGNVNIANDSGKLRLGASNDLQIYHNGSHSYIVDSGTGNLILQTSKLNINNAAGTEALIHATENGKVELYYDNSVKLETTSTGTVTTGVLAVNDATSADAGNRISVGTSQDIRIYHIAGNDSYFRNYTGDTYLQGNNSGTVVNNIKFENSNGATELYFNSSKKFETTSTGAKIDSGQLHIESASATTSDLDMLIVDGGSAGFNGNNDADTEYGIQFKGCSFSTGTGIQQRVGSQILMRKEGTWNGASGGGNECKTTIAFTNSTGLFTDGTLAQVDRLLINSDGNVQIPNDNAKLQLGASQDLEIYHDGTYNRIAANAQIFLQNKAANETYIAAYENGAVELYHDNSKKFETYASGVFVPDSANLAAGNSQDIKIRHDGSNSYFQNDTGNLLIQPKAGYNCLNLITSSNGGHVELYYDNAKKFETLSYGAKVTGSLTATNNINNESDTGKLMLGAGNDLQIYHDGTHSYLDNSTGSFFVKGDTIKLRGKSADEDMIEAFVNGAVRLYYDNTLMLATINNGIKLHNGGSSTLKFFDVNTSTIMMYTHSVDLRWYDDVNNDNIMQLSQNGDLNIDGSYSNSGVDYAEYFESTDGSAIAIGTTVVLEDGKVRAATSSETPIGVIRPKTSGTSVTGGVNQLNWQGKYLVDDYDGQVMESAVHCTWTDNNEVNQQCWKDRPPTGVTIPSDAVETTRERPKLNPLFDESKTYVPRSERDEWNCVGLLGQIPITKGQPTSSSWIKMKDKNSTVELWMVK